LVKIELPGYMPYETNLIRKVDGWIAGNIVFGGLIGLAVDAITGGMYKLTPEQIQSELMNQTADAVKRPPCRTSQILPSGGTFKPSNPQTFSNPIILHRSVFSKTILQNAK
jgi:hypothetical protein